MTGDVVMTAERSEIVGSGPVMFGPGMVVIEV
jgi:hypothetical protein